MTKDDKYLWRLCKNIIAGRFNWRRYCSRQSYYGREICVTNLFLWTDWLHSKLPLFKNARCGI